MGGGLHLAPGDPYMLALLPFLDEAKRGLSLPLLARPLAPNLLLESSDSFLLPLSLPPPKNCPYMLPLLPFLDEAKRGLSLAARSRLGAPSWSVVKLTLFLSVWCGLPFLARLLSLLLLAPFSPAPPLALLLKVLRNHGLKSAGPPLRGDESC